MVAEEPLDSTLRGAKWKTVFLTFPVEFSLTLFPDIEFHAHYLLKSIRRPAALNDSSHGCLSFLAAAAYAPAALLLLARVSGFVPRIQFSVFADWFPDSKNLSPGPQKAPFDSWLAPGTCILVV